MSNCATAERVGRSRDKVTTVGYQMRHMPIALSDALRLAASLRKTTKEKIVIEALTIGLRVMQESESNG